ncbi:MAG: NAD-dependent epimerase/dehydratase family protein [Spirochaetes bacterium]|nr:NAD-dependent epimerase/dehydratase family protein [Spirochaetota bacterium]
MKVLFIGGTGNISGASSRLAVERGIDLYHLNRGTQAPMPGVKSLSADIHDPVATAAALAGHEWDAVVDWIAYGPDAVERDVELFLGRTRQYVFISSASCYQKPPRTPFITEETPLENPYWEYSRNKIACEEAARRAHRERGFPVTIVRPSLTYERVIPVALGGWADYTIVERMKAGRKVVVHGDGTSLWTITHAEDFALGFVGLLGRGEAVGEAYHITSDECLTWDQIYRAVGAAAGVEAKLVHVPTDLIREVDAGAAAGILGDKGWSAIFDNRKIKALVPGFKASIPFAEGIRRTVAWFEADPARRRIHEPNNLILDRILERYARAFPGAL